MSNTDLLTRAPKCRTEPPPGYKWVGGPFNVVLPFCEKDAPMALELLRWIRDLGPVKRDLTLVYDKGLHPKFMQELFSMAKEAFPTGNLGHIKLGRTGAKWPGSNNFVWNTICQSLRLTKEPRPWLLIEPDVAPCKPGWVEILEKEYEAAQKPFMGPWVEYYDLMNGAGIYPPDVVSWCPEYFKLDPLKAPAYDVAIAPEIIWFVHKATHLMPHIWYSRANGRPGGMDKRLPEWNEKMAEWVLDHNAVIAHRCKDEKLIDFLRSKHTKL